MLEDGARVFEIIPSPAQAKGDVIAGDELVLRHSYCDRFRRMLLWLSKTRPSGARSRP